MKLVRTLSFALFVVVLGISAQTRAAAWCGCSLEEEGQNWGFFDCGSSENCDTNKSHCAEGYCGAGNVDDYYCGNGQLLVYCTPIEG